MVEIHLPIHSMPFIGREDEVGAIVRRLDEPDCHLLTLVGPGGIGKTRLATEVARQFVAVDGVYFVDLQPVSSGEQLVAATANTLNIIFSGAESPRVQLLNSLIGRESLLLLDNFEQLLNSVDLLADIVKAAPGIKLLVTSREVLNIQEEWAWQVGGLQVPQRVSEKVDFNSEINLTPGPSPHAERGERQTHKDDEAYQKPSQTATNIESFAAVQLFVDRARRIRQDFTLAGQEAHVTRTCQLVEGMPLALELAATWIRILTCAEIVEEIQHSLNILTTKMRNTAERHRSMQAVFDHSWRLLTDEERGIFPKLSVFRGGFRREAAEQVAGASLDILAGLVDKSFLRVSAAGRYTVHELMRQYGEARLDDESTAEKYRKTLNPRPQGEGGKTPSDAKAEAQYRHCLYYSGFLYARQLPLRGPGQAKALDEIEDELDNVRASWEWAVGNDMRDAVHQSMHSFFVFCHIRAQAVEGERLFEIAIKRFEHEDSATLAYLLLGRTWLADYGGRVVGVEEYPRAIRLAYEFWTDDVIAMPLRSYIGIHQNLISSGLFDHKRQERVYHDFLERFRAHNQHWGVAWMQFCLGDLVEIVGRKEESERYMRECKGSFRQLGDRFMSCWPDINLGSFLFEDRKYDEARQLWQEHQEIGEWLRSGDMIVYATTRKGGIAWELHDYIEAKHIVAEGLRCYLEANSHCINLMQLLGVLLRVFMSENQQERAVELTGFARQYAESVRASDIVVGISQIMDTLTHNLPQDIYQQAVERGKKFHLRTVLEQLLEELSSYSPPAPATRQLDSLTERELEVLRLVAAGRSNRQIAHDLVLTLNTVKSHIYHIYDKLGVESRVQAVTRARELRLL